MNGESSSELLSGGIRGGMGLDCGEQRKLVLS